MVVFQYYRTVARFRWGEEGGWALQLFPEDIIYVSWNLWSFYTHGGSTINALAPPPTSALRTLPYKPLPIRIITWESVRIILLYNAQDAYNLSECMFNRKWRIYIVHGPQKLSRKRRSNFPTSSKRPSPHPHPSSTDRFLSMTVHYLY